LKKILSKSILSPRELYQLSLASAFINTVQNAMLFDLLEIKLPVAGMTK